MTQKFEYGLELINTPDTGDPFEGADSVLLANSIPTTRFSVGGIDYNLQGAFGCGTSSGFSEVNQFFVLEGASPDLIGTITAQVAGSQHTPTVGPEPSTILGRLFAGGLILHFSCTVPDGIAQRFAPKRAYLVDPEKVSGASKQAGLRVEKVRG